MDGDSAAIAKLASLVQLVFAALLGTVASIGFEPGFVPRGLVLFIAFGLPAAVGAIGVRRRRPALLFAAGAVSFVGGFGGPGGGPPPGRRGPGPPGSGDDGLPFAGVPPELRDRVQRLLREQPDVTASPLEFSHRSAPERSLSILGLLGRYPGTAALSALAVTLVAIAGQAAPALIQYAIDHGMSPGHQSTTVVVAVGALLVLCVLITGLAQRSQARLTGRLAANVMQHLRERVFTQLLRLGLDYHTSEKDGVILTRMTGDIENLEQLLQDGLAQLFIQALTMVVITVVLLKMNVTLALITLALTVPVLLTASLWFRRTSARAYRSVRDRVADVIGDLSEQVHGVRTVAAYNRQGWNVGGHGTVLGRYRAANNRAAMINAVYGPGTLLLGYLVQASLLAIGGRMVLRGELAIGQLVAFFLYLGRFFAPIQLLVQQYNALQQGQSSIAKLRAFFALEPNTLEAADAIELPPVLGRIDFEGVTFGYGDSPAVLSGLDLHIEPGETVAIVGPTGAGKSTIAKLISRLYDPRTGAVRLDGYDLREINVESLRRQLGVVPQEPFLFSGALRDNIAFARPQADEDDVWEAVDAVGLREVVERLPDGLDTVVHERGQSLSSGERQLVALARAFHAQPRVLVLDEATSNLDLASESRIEAALEVLLKGRTAVLIAHRLTTASKADRIAVVDAGRIAEIGSHAQLLAAGGLYAQMYATWEGQSAAA